MEVRKVRYARFVPLALVTFALSATNARADLLCAQNNPEGYRSADLCRTERFPQIDAKAVVHNLRREWENMREDVARSIVEATLTMFFIKSSPPPTGNPPPPNVTPPPPTGGGNPPPPPPPPPPDGQGGVPPINPPPGEPPPSGTPEPTGFVLAVMGAGLVSFCGWRRRKAKRDE